VKGWIKFRREEVAQPRGGEWHQAKEVHVLTACALTVKTEERPGNDYPGYGAKICPTCAAAKDEP
jgi:hypothetical protein